MNILRVGVMLLASLLLHPLDARAAGPPSITGFSPSGGAPGVSVSIVGTELAGATSVKFNGLTATYTVTSATQITATVPPNATTGPVSVTTAGGTATTSTSFFVAPRITGFSPTGGAPGTRVVITGTNFTGLTSLNLLWHAQLYSGTLAFSSYTLDSATQITGVIPDAAYSGALQVVTVGGSAALGLFTVAPRVTDFSPQSGPPGTVVTFSGKNLGGATANFGGAVTRISTEVGCGGGGALGIQGGCANYTYQATVPEGALTGPITVANAGGTAVSSKPFIVTPRITGFSPGAGGPGASVTITGANFTGATAVTFGGSSATFSVTSATQITATVPASAVTGPIAVTTQAGTSTLTGTSASAFAVPPLVASFAPAGGGAGTAVTITGSGFTGATAVTFGGASATFTVNSPTQITAAVPGSAITGPIAVTTPGGTGTSATAFTAPPRITSFSPTSGAGGTTVIIYGANFRGATAVTFGGRPATFRFPSQTQITATAPDGASGPISVTTPIGTATSTASFGAARTVGGVLGEFEEREPSITPTEELDQGEVMGLGIEEPVERLPRTGGPLPSPAIAFVGLALAACGIVLRRRR